MKARLEVFRCEGCGREFSVRVKPGTVTRLHVECPASPGNYGRILPQLTLPVDKASLSATGGLR